MKEATRSAEDDTREAREIVKSIEVYAKAYAELQSWQEKSNLIPRGDQKTGSIGEFYATLYLKTKYPDASVKNGGHSEKGWDIEINHRGRVWRVQVKTVSAFAKMNRMSPIHEGWNELFVLYLGRNFRPLGFWIVDDNSIMTRRPVWKSCSCPRPGVPNSGSPDIQFGENRIEELRAAISGYIDTAPPGSENDNTAEVASPISSSSPPSQISSIGMSRLGSTWPDREAARLAIEGVYDWSGDEVAVWMNDDDPGTLGALSLSTKHPVSPEAVLWGVARGRKLSTAYPDWAPSYWFEALMLESDERMDQARRSRD